MSSLSGSSAAHAATMTPPLRLVLPISAPACSKPPQPVELGQVTDPSAALDPSSGELVLSWNQDLALVRAGLRAPLARIDLRSGRVLQRADVDGLTSCSGSKPSQFAVSAEPSVSVGPDGTAYLVASEANPDPGTPWNMDPTGPAPQGSAASAWLRAGGIAPVSQLGTFTPYLAGQLEVTTLADQDVAGHAWAVVTQVEAKTTSLDVAETRDAGRTWSAPRSVLRTTELPYDVELVETGDTLLLVYGLLPSTESEIVVVVRRSTDHGSTFGAPREIGRFPFIVPSSRDGVPLGGPGWPTVDAAAGPSGRVLVAWPAVPRVEGAANAHVEVTTSADAGNSWSTARRIESGPEVAVAPVVAVSGDRHVAVAWARYDASALDSDGGPLPGRHVVARSADGLEWTEPEDVASFDLRAARGDAVSYDDTCPPEGCRLPYYVGSEQALVGLPQGFAYVFALPRPNAVAAVTDLFVTRTRDVAGIRRPRIRTLRLTRQAGGRLRIRAGVVDATRVTARTEGGAVALLRRRTATRFDGALRLTTSDRRRRRVRVTVRASGPGGTTNRAGSSSRG